MNAIPSGKVKVYLELQDGLVCEVTGSVAGFSLSQELDDEQISLYGLTGIPIPAAESFTLELRGVHSLWTEGKQISARRSDYEWKCDFCGRPNKRERETCQSCGAVRPFIYN